MEVAFTHSISLSHCLLMLVLVCMGTQSTVNNIDDVQYFHGEGSDSQQFKILHTDGSHMLIGARNHMYNVSLNDLQVMMRISWAPSRSDRDICVMRFVDYADQCENYITSVFRTGRDELTVCGTNAYRPWCKRYANADTGYGYIPSSGFDGVTISPYDYRHNSTAAYIDGSIYSGTVGDLMGRDALFSRNDGIRTAQYHTEQLNNPDFVNSFQYNDMVYFTFRETAMEHMNCGKAIYSRIGRVCKSDQGGNFVLEHSWTTFFKSRLNCSLPGDYPFYFDHIQSSSSIGYGNTYPSLSSANSSAVIYAVFTTGQNSIRGSAVCAYKMSDIEATFSGAFKAQSNSESLWLPVSLDDTPNPHPATRCSNESVKFSDEMFVRRHVLMNEAVPALGGAPVFVSADQQAQLTNIAVDLQVFGVDLRYYDIIYTGTENGHVLKHINVLNNEDGSLSSVLIEDIRVFDSDTPVTQISIYRHDADTRIRHADNKLVVVSANDVVAIPLHRCQRYQDCSSCVASRDPDCSWTSDGVCAFSNDGIQSISTGRSWQCSQHTPSTVPTQQPDTEPTVAHSCLPCHCSNSEHNVAGFAIGTTTTATPTRSNNGAVVESVIGKESAETSAELEDKSADNTAEPVPPVAARQDCTRSSNLYTASTLATAIIATLVVAVIIGLIIGYFLALRFRRRNKSVPPLIVQRDPSRETLNRSHSGYCNNEHSLTSPLQDKNVNLCYNNLDKPSVPHQASTMNDPNIINLSLNKGKPSNSKTYV